MSRQYTFEEAVRTKTTGLRLTEQQELELGNIFLVLKKLTTVAYNLETGVVYPTRYIKLLPLQSINYILGGKKFLNEWGRKCTIDSIVRNKKGQLIALCSWKNKQWSMYLETLLSETTILVDKRIQHYYLDLLTLDTVRELIQRLNEKKDKYEQMYLAQIREANKDLYTELNKHQTPELEVSRDAIKRAKASIRKDGKEIATVWNSTLTKEEQNKLLSWIWENIYSARLYVVEGTGLDKSISELYPDEQYGKKRRTKPSECSKNSIGGYISLNTDVGAPLDILNKLAHKKDLNNILIQNKGSNKWRFNSYLLVLFLLNNYNDIGFKTGVTNLNKQLKLA